MGPRSNNGVRSCGRPSSTQFTAKFSGLPCRECVSSQTTDRFFRWGPKTRGARLKTPARLQMMTTVIFACPKCGLAHQVTQVQVPTKKSGRFDCVDCGATIHSWHGVFDYSGCKAVRMYRGNRAFINPATFAGPADPRRRGLSKPGGPH